MRSAILTQDDIESLFHELVSRQLQELFETKHLYQSTTIDLSPLEQQIEQVKDPSGERMGNMGERVEGEPSQD